MADARGPVETAAGRRSPSSTGDRAIVGLFIAVAATIGLIAAFTVLAGEEGPLAGGSLPPSPTGEPPAATPRPTPAPTPDATPDVPLLTPSPLDAAWAASPIGGGHAVGTILDYECPPGGTSTTIWGTDIYTDDSSVCTAAVHAGLITLVAGGSVTIQIGPGQAEYVGSSRNGIVSSSWPAWPSSYVFVVP